MISSDAYIGWVTIGTWSPSPLTWINEIYGFPYFGPQWMLSPLERKNLRLPPLDKSLTTPLDIIPRFNWLVSRHSEHVLQEQALKIGLKKPVRHIYCIGDNICTDIFGANLYNKYLQRARDTEIISQVQAQVHFTFFL